MNQFYSRVNNIIDSKIQNLFKVSSTILSSIRDIIGNDSQVIQEIHVAVTLISLADIVVNICDKIKNQQKTQEERAFASLLKVMFQITRDLLKSEVQHLTLDAGFGKRKDIINHLLSSFKESSEWNSYLPDHPVIINFRNNYRLSQKSFIQ